MTERDSLLRLVQEAGSLTWSAWCDSLHSLNALFLDLSSKMLT